jgi:Helicase associated domain
LETWYQRLRELREYRQEHGDCLVPRLYPPQQKMATWVGNVRMNRQCLSATKVQVLAAVGFVWAKRTPTGQALWDERYAQLQAYQAVHGHCNVPAKYKVSVELQRLLRLSL